MNAATPPPVPKRRRIPLPFRWFIGLWLLSVLAVLLVHPVENWRGKRAWAKCRREMAARGEALDWNAYIPPPVPDAQNLFAAPHMAEWFVGRGTNDLVRRFDPERLYDFSLRSHTNVIAEITVVSPRDPIVSTNVDLVLFYAPPVLTCERYSTNDSQFVIIPLVVMDQVPLRDVIKNLARQAGPNYVIDPKLGFDDPNWSEPIVSGRWTDTTALSLLFALLSNYGMQWVDDPNTGIARITANPSGRSSIYVDPAVREPLRELIQHVLDTDALDVAEPSTRTVQGFELVVHSAPSRTRPARLVLQTDKKPDPKELAKFFSLGSLTSGVHQAGLRLEPDGNGIRILRSPPPYTAGEYLAWSDQFTKEFLVIRDALKRPYARMNVNYERPVPIPNFRAIRAVTQTLAQRAQCHLLLGQPEAALQELTLIHDMCRLLECQPSGKPVGLIAVATEYETVESYARTVGDGLRMHAWRETQLVQIQEQLKAINLLPLLAQGLRTERAAMFRVIEQAITSKRPDLLEARTNWERLHNLGKYRFLKIPRGWIYQNFVRMTHLQQMTIDSLDLTNRVVRVDDISRFNEEIRRDLDHPSPYRSISAVTLPNYTWAIQKVARVQSTADQTQITCALERYRLAKGKYPETLDALAPQFLEKIPRDIISGQPLKYYPTNAESFALYSVGWNKTDEGGVSKSKKDGSVDHAEGDWIWK